MYKLILLLIACTLSAAGIAQVTEEEKVQQLIRDQEQSKHAELMRLMDQGIELMDNEQYEEANVKFKEVLKSSKVVPTDLCFYFGKNSFHMGKYRQSIDWLNKYLELKGTKGRYYEECVEYLEKSNEAFLTLREEEKKEVHNILTANYDIDCGPSGKVVCPVCKGKGVIITKGAFGDSYKACPYSDDHGNLTCEEYNKLLRGELEPKF